MWRREDQLRTQVWRMCQRPTGIRGGMDDEHRVFGRDVSQGEGE